MSCTRIYLAMQRDVIYNCIASNLYIYDPNRIASERSHIESAREIPYDAIYIYVRRESHETIYKLSRVRGHTTKQSMPAGHAERA